jgi:hypothetical protein
MYKDSGNPNRVRTGDTVALTVAFLQSTGMVVGEPGFARGTVISLSKPLPNSGWQLVEIAWKEPHENMPRRLLAANVARVGSRAFNERV